MRLPTALFGAFLTMALAGAAAAGSQFHPAMPGLFGLIGEFIRCGDPPDGALLSFDVLDEAEFLELLEGSAPEAPTP
ncbi:MAG: hypothetical protein EON47_12335 [Acetobacteraceae bacterium]|nr:MAG: hypothetical protein EON47_12335 [Acetobacteraceae bacterium]